MMNDRFSAELRQHLLATADERPGDGRLTDIVDGIAVTAQRPTLLARLTWAPRRMGPFPSAAVRYGLIALALIIAAVAAVAFGSAQPRPPRDLGIFAPIAGHIIFCDNPDHHTDLWSVDPDAPSPVAAVARIGFDCAGVDSFAELFGWSSDGTKLLFGRLEPNNGVCGHLYILHADGTETQVTPEWVRGAAMSPDGSRVVFADARSGALYVVNAEGGQPVRIVDGAEPAFSPDGTQIAYLAGSEIGCSPQPRERAHIWVANVDGGDAHEILSDEPALAGIYFSLTWSPGDRIALERGDPKGPAIYTFARDGSKFTLAVPKGTEPNWSPDGSRLAYRLPCCDPRPTWWNLRIADADGANVRTFDVGSSGPWHPGTPERAAK